MDRSILASMPDEEKIKRTEFEEMKKRGVIVDYDKVNDPVMWWVSINEFPYDNVEEHFVLRFLSSDWSKYAGLLNFYHKNGYEIRMNKPDRQSVKRTHFHLIKRK